MGANPWFVDAFGHAYRTVYDSRNLTQARSEARALLASGIASPALDLACGFGRHTLALRELGLQVVGCDLSRELLSDARELFEANAQPASGLVLGDMRQLPFGGRTFSSVLILFTSFGYFGDDGDAHALDEIVRVSRRKGHVVLDLMNPARVRRTLVCETRRRVQGGTLVEHRALLDGGRRVEKRVEIRADSGSVTGWTENVRLYTPDELSALFSPRSLSIARVDGDFDGQPWTADSPRLLVHGVLK